MTRLKNLNFQKFSKIQIFKNSKKFKPHMKIQIQIQKIKPHLGRPNENAPCCARACVFGCERNPNKLVGFGDDHHYQRRKNSGACQGLAAVRFHRRMRRSLGTFIVHVPVSTTRKRKRKYLSKVFWTTTCVVCLDDFDENNEKGKETVVTPCGHMFHWRCVRAVRNRKCPTCRARLHLKLKLP